MIVLYIAMKLTSNFVALLFCNFSCKVGKFVIIEVPFRKLDTEMSTTNTHPLGEPTSWTELYEHILADPLFYSGPFFIIVIFLIIATIAARRLAEDRNWAPKPRRVPAPAGKKVLVYSCEHPKQSVVLSRKHLLNFHNNCFIDSFIPSDFPIESLNFPLIFFFSNLNLLYIS